MGHKSRDGHGGDWDAYWQNAASASAHKQGGPQDEVLERYWLGFFAEILPRLEIDSRMLDIACGNGAVPGFACGVLRDLGRVGDAAVYGLDGSPAALGEMRRRHPGIQGLAAHGASLPFRDNSLDLVSSQFGLEYAGADAVMEAARVVKPGGMFCAILHLHGGAIFQECEVNLKAINGVRASRLLPCFEALFHAALALQQGRADRDSFLAADKSFAAAVAAVEDVFRHWGKTVADGMLLRLYTDVAHMYRRLKYYDQAEVFAWIGNMGRELDAYAGRMASMLEAALDESGLERLTGQLTGEHFLIHRRETLNMGPQARPAAWVVVAEKITSHK